MFVPLYDYNKLKSIPFQYVTVLLIALNIAVFLIQTSGMSLPAVASFGLIPKELIEVRYFGGPAFGENDLIAVPEGYTLLTYTFFHGDIFHLFSNMIFLWVFGDNVEDAVGHLKFLIFYVLCGVLAGMLHVHMSPESGRPLIGASGAVAGVIAAYLLLHPRVRIWVLVFRLIPLRISAMWALGAWIALQFVMVYLSQMGIQQGPVAWWAHIGGLAAGAVLILFMRRPGVVLFDRDIRSES
ncbi:MAG: rhomboid family intramembrane serine protease [Hyphomicrobiaceae bacterium]